MSEADAPTIVPTTEPTASRALPEVPGPLARKVLAFEFLVLAEYWVAPWFLGVENYAGIWSDVGVALFLLFASSLVVLVVLPLRPHLRLATEARRDRVAFLGLWFGALIAGLFVTNTFQVGRGPTTGAVALGWSTTYTPFGAWPTGTAYVSPLRLFATANVEIVALLTLLSFLGSSAVRLAAHRNAVACAVDGPRPSAWGQRAAALVVWTPLGFITGCSACAPIYLSAIGLFAPAAVAGGLSGIPLVPWIGFAGLLYLASFGLALHLLRRATAPRVASASPRIEVSR